MSRTTKKQRKEARAKIRRVMEAQDQEVRQSWKRPPMRLRIIEWFRPGTIKAWTAAREIEHERRLRRAFRKTQKTITEGR